jgi:hypothetical protein
MPSARNFPSDNLQILPTDSHYRNTSDKCNKLLRFTPKALQVKIDKKKTMSLPDEMLLHIAEGLIPSQIKDSNTQQLQSNKQWDAYFREHATDNTNLLAFSQMNKAGARVAQEALVRHVRIDDPTHKLPLLIRTLLEKPSLANCIHTIVERDSC